MIHSSVKCFWCMATNSFRRGYHGTLDRMRTNNWSGDGCECMSAMLSNAGKRRNCEKNCFERRVSVVIFRCNDSWIYQLMCLATNWYCQNKITKYEGNAFHLPKGDFGCFFQQCPFTNFRWIFFSEKLLAHSSTSCGLKSRKTSCSLLKGKKRRSC